uniref:Transmembrane protein n=1 Tax=Chromera velia CCMP2878 TaxID=1169474 RepID=A0A0G4IE72_9ALVE|eukprot:Cvel_13584.t1-p1 / transcript=Cvel_13584.t1 / gene=Cvel_13584 / organism=Chromera_velia_CCMP2878 / gene_product=hypothetical protein / transcript_product=hypothetical protein / location=Cvel_scaffold934:5665-9389(+) / protein_length=518 / sequence_SO=supercontig / SO=protein_coding / is_pseudo=false
MRAQRGDRDVQARQLAGSLWDQEGFRWGIIFGGVALVGLVVGLVLWLVLRKRGKKDKEEKEEIEKGNAEENQTQGLRLGASPQENRKSHDVGLVHNQERQSLVVMNQHHRMSVGDIALDEFHKQFVESRSIDRKGLEAEEMDADGEEHNLKDSLPWPEATDSRQKSQGLTTENAREGGRGAGVFASPESVALHERHRRQKEEEEREGESGVKEGGKETDQDARPTGDPSLTPTAAAAFLMANAAKWMEMDDPAEGDYRGEEEVPEKETKTPYNSREKDKDPEGQSGRPSPPRLGLPPEAINPISSPSSASGQGGPPSPSLHSGWEAPEGMEEQSLPAFPVTPSPQSGRSLDFRGEGQGDQIATEEGRPPTPLPPVSPFAGAAAGNHRHGKKKKRKRRRSAEAEQIAAEQQRLAGMNGGGDEQRNGGADGDNADGGESPVFAFKVTVRNHRHGKKKKRKRRRSAEAEQIAAEQQRLAGMNGGGDEQRNGGADGDNADGGESPVFAFKVTADPRDSQEKD